MGAEEEDNRNLNQPAVCVRHKQNSFFTTFFSASYLIVFCGDNFRDKSLFISVRNIGDDDDDDYDDDDDDIIDIEQEGREIFLWTGLTVNHFDIVHRITRILKLIPDKFATGCAIAAENLPGDSGDFLLNLVAKLYDEALTEALDKNYPNSFVSTLLDLRESFREITFAFVERQIDQREIEKFLRRCQPVLSASKIIVDWAYSQLIYFRKNQAYSDDASEKLLDLCLDLNSKPNLLSEYRRLRREQ
jgi:hypothetical protein